MKIFENKHTAFCAFLKAIMYKRHFASKTTNCKYCSKFVGFLLHLPSFLWTMARCKKDFRKSAKLKIRHTVMKTAECERENNMVWSFLICIPISREGSDRVDSVDSVVSYWANLNPRKSADMAASSNARDCFDKILISKQDCFETLLPSKTGASKLASLLPLPSFCQILHSTFYPCLGPFSLQDRKICPEEESRYFLNGSMVPQFQIYVD